MHPALAKEPSLNTLTAVMLRAAENYGAERHEALNPPRTSGPCTSGTSVVDNEKNSGPRRRKIRKTSPRTLRKSSRHSVESRDKKEEIYRIEDSIILSRLSSEHEFVLIGD